MITVTKDVNWKDFGSVSVRKFFMPEDMSQVISQNQLALLNEIYSREGLSAVLRYLVDHEKIDLSVAKRWIKSLGFKDDSCKDCKVEEPIDQTVKFEHYCTFDHEVWIGNAVSVCPICGTDGLHERPNVFIRAVDWVRDLV